MRIFPEICARTLWPLASSTRNIAFGRGSTTVPSTSIAPSFFGKLFPSPRHGKHADRSAYVDCSLERIRVAKEPTTQSPGERPGPVSKDTKVRSFSATSPATLSRAGIKPVLLLRAVEQSEHLRALRRDGDGVLEMGRARAVPGHDRPAVLQHLGVGAALVEHRLDSQRQADVQPDSPPGATVIGHLRLLVHGGADAVADVLAHHAVARDGGHALHRVADVGQPVARAHLG